MTRPRCAVSVLPSEGGDAERLIASIAAAKALGPGDLGGIVLLPVWPDTDPRKALLDAAAVAEGGGFDWLLAVSAAESLSADIFVKASPALRLHDAVWGAAGIATDDNPDPKVERVTRLAAQDLPAFFHAALRWWIGPTHFVRPALALAALHGPETSAWYADYMLHLWRAGSAYKTAQRLTLFHDVLPPVGESVKARLIEDLGRRPVFMNVRYGNAVARLAYTGLNPVIEREQMRGLFFEAEELGFLADRLPRGLRVVDVGANTGNHTIFFALMMGAQSVLPIEAEPRAVEAIRAAVAENSLANIDMSRLGIAVGAIIGRLRPVPSLTAGLGATHFVPDPQGPVQQVPLDEIVDGPVDFLKIDVEGMEMAVLDGADRLIATHRPALYIEVVDERIGEFLAWTERHQYRIEKLFPDKTHCNYFLTADKRS